MKFSGWAYNFLELSSTVDNFSSLPRSRFRGFCRRRGRIVVVAASLLGSEITGISLQSDITKTLTLIRKSNKPFSNKSLRNSKKTKHKRKTCTACFSFTSSPLVCCVGHANRKTLWRQTNVITTILPLFKGF